MDAAGSKLETKELTILLVVVNGRMRSARCTVSR